jgi:hypothetical protein
MALSALLFSWKGMNHFSAFSRLSRASLNSLAIFLEALLIAA